MTGDLLRIAVGRPDHAIVVALDGDLDIATAPQVVALADDGGAGPGLPLVLDLEHLAFVDSSGVRALIELNMLLAGSSSRLVLARPGPAVRRLLDMSGLLTVMPLADDPGPDAVRRAATVTPT